MLQYSVYLELSNIAKHYGAELILRDVTCYVDQNEVIGLVGANGVGKSTLCNILTGSDAEYDGHIQFHPGTKVAYFKQELESTELKDVSVFDYILKSQEHILAIETEYHALLSSLEKGETHQDLLDKLGELQDLYYSTGAHNLIDRIEAVLAGLGIHSTPQEDSIRNITWDSKMGELSGGERKIVELATILLNESANVLILDEPTNHLDLSARIWLESFIKGFKGSVIIVSHDRYLLNTVATKVWEISNKTVHTFKGNYDSYRKQKAAIFEALTKQYENESKEHARLLESLKGLRHKLDLGGGPAIVAQFNAMKSRIEKFESQRIEKPETRPDLGLSLHQNLPKGYNVLRLTNFSFSYSSVRTIFKNHNFTATKNDKVALLGNNGSGKSTLLKLMLAKYCYMHQENPASYGIQDFYTSFIEAVKDNEKFYLGPGVKIGYYSQHHTQLPVKQTIRSYLWDLGIRDETKFQGIIKKYNFDKKTVDDKYIGDLSGGEKSKLQFMMLMLSEPNVLLLDEPINHLDIDSMRVVETVLKDFKGALFVISHDRYFLNQVVNRIVYIHNNEINDFFGTIDEYLAAFYTK